MRIILYILSFFSVNLKATPSKIRSDIPNKDKNQSIYTDCAGAFRGVFLESLKESSIKLASLNNNEKQITKRPIVSLKTSDSTKPKKTRLMLDNLNPNIKTSIIKTYLNQAKDTNTFVNKSKVRDHIKKTRSIEYENSKLSDSHSNREIHKTVQDKNILIQTNSEYNDTMDNHEVIYINSSSDIEMNDSEQDKNISIQDDDEKHQSKEKHKINFLVYNKKISNNDAEEDDNTLLQNENEQVLMNENSEINSSISNTGNFKEEKKMNFSKKTKISFTELDSVYRSDVKIYSLNSYEKDLYDKYDLKSMNPKNCKIYKALSREDINETNINETNLTNIFICNEGTYYYKTKNETFFTFASFKNYILSTIYGAYVFKTNDNKYYFIVPDKTIEEIDINKNQTKYILRSENQFFVKNFKKFKKLLKIKVKNQYQEFNKRILESIEKINILSEETRKYFLSTENFPEIRPWKSFENDKKKIFFCINLINEYEDSKTYLKILSFENDEINFQKEIFYSESNLQTIKSKKKLTEDLLETAVENTTKESFDVFTSIYYLNEQFLSNDIPILSSRKKKPLYGLDFILEIDFFSYINKIYDAKIIDNFQINYLLKCIIKFNKYEFSTFCKFIDCFCTEINIEDSTQNWEKLRAKIFEVFKSGTSGIDIIFPELIFFESYILSIIELNNPIKKLFGIVHVTFFLYVFESFMKLDFKNIIKNFKFDLENEKIVNENNVCRSDNESNLRKNFCIKTKNLKIKFLSDLIIFHRILIIIVHPFLDDECFTNYLTFSIILRTKYKQIFCEKRRIVFYSDTLCKITDFDFFFKNIFFVFEINFLSEDKFDLFIKNGSNREFIQEINDIKKPFKAHNLFKQFKHKFLAKKKKSEMQLSKNAKLYIIFANYYYYLNLQNEKSEKEKKLSVIFLQNFKQFLEDYKFYLLADNRIFIYDLFDFLKKKHFLIMT
ncbi:hypothetical protein GVAV_000718 [Gurleya vavrai]